MNTQKTLVIAKPCHENWGNMNPTEKGRFCSSCTKEVVDFRQKTKEEVIDYLENYNGEGQTCGQFNPSQIDKVGKIYINSSLYKRIGISFLAFLGLFSFKEAKGQKMGKVAIKGDVGYQSYNPENQKMTITIFGTVRTMSGDKIANAEVKFNHEGKQLAVTKTIANGSFTIQVNVDKSMKAIMMYTNAPGYERKINVIPEPQKERIKIDVIMESEMMMLGEVAIVVDTIKTDTVITCTNIIPEDTTAEIIKISTLETVEKIIPETNEDPQDSTKIVHQVDLISDKKWLHVYPNPTTTNATIEWFDDSENLVEVYDMNEKLIWSAKIKGTKTVFNTTNLAEGNYLVKISSMTTGKSESAQLVIVR